MNIQSALCFWLGSLDSRVAAGHKDVGGTHDIRFCFRRKLVRAFIGLPPNRQGIWLVRLQPYPAQGLPASDLTIAGYSGRRRGECAMPAQFGGSGSEYPLWRRITRPYRPGATSTPRDAILLLRDAGGKFHARMARREDVQRFPLVLRTELEKHDPCARLIALDRTVKLPEALFAKPLPGNPLAVQEAKETRRQREYLDGARREINRELMVRNQTLVRDAKRSRPCVCQVCGLSFAEMYGDLGDGFIEGHHKKSLAAAPRGGKRLTVDDIVLVCSNCHRMLHRGRKIMDWRRLRQRVLGLRRKARK
ncbi:MAG: hypothetical protein BIFFINMI_02015 [Phycisphaerae bacterium]|nr:hypothetical protein [Phycisphaerae bacterium]